MDRERRVVIACAVEFERLGERVIATSEDVSRRGLFLRTRAFFPIGEVVELAITVPTGTVVRVISCVAHVLPEAAAHALGRHAGMGFEFLEADEERLQALQAFLEPLLGVAPPLVSQLGRLRVVVADPSGPLLERLSMSLGEAGFQVIMTRHGGEAYAASLEAAPDLLLIADEMPVMDGWTLIKMIATRPRLAEVPILLMSDSQDDITRLKAYRHGVRDFMQKPFTDEELTIRLRRLARAGAPQSDKVVLRGNLPDIGVATLLSMFEFEQKSGVLALLRPDGMARLFLAKGRIVKVEASIDGGPQEKVMSVLGWLWGTFEFSACEVVGEDELRCSTSALLIEHARLSDERAATK